MGTLSTQHQDFLGHFIKDVKLLQFLTDETFLIIKNISPLIETFLIIKNISPLIKNPD